VIPLASVNVSVLGAVGSASGATVSVRPSADRLTACATAPLASESATAAAGTDATGSSKTIRIGSRDQTFVAAGAGTRSATFGGVRSRRTCTGAESARERDLPFW
jgi:hypothetical protein